SACARCTSHGGGNERLPGEAERAGRGRGLRGAGAGAAGGARGDPRRRGAGAGADGGSPLGGVRGRRGRVVLERVEWGVAGGGGRGGVGARGRGEGARPETMERWCREVYGRIEVVAAPGVNVGAPPVLGGFGFASGWFDEAWQGFGDGSFVLSRWTVGEGWA